MSDEREDNNKGAGASAIGDWIVGALLAVEWSKMRPFTGLAILICFGHTSFGAWFLVATGAIGGWGQLITEFGGMYGDNFLFAAVLSWIMINLWEVVKMHDWFFGAFVHWLRLRELREWVMKKDAEWDEKMRARDAARDEQLRAEGYSQGFNDGVNSVARPGEFDAD